MVVHIFGKKQKLYKWFDGDTSSNVRITEISEQYNFFYEKLMSLEGGLEPPTLWLTATRSNQLSYSSSCLAFRSESMCRCFQKRIQVLRRQEATTNPNSFDGQQTQKFHDVENTKQSTVPHPSYPPPRGRRQPAAVSEQSPPPRACPFLPLVGTVVLVPSPLHWWGVE
jgi:hypothetical protein